MKQRLLFCVIFLLFVSLHAQEWMQWRGPDQNGVSKQTGFPDTWARNIIWSAPFGARTAPLVLDGKVYLINKVGDGAKLQERVMALDANNGQVVWEYRFNVFHTDIVSNRLGWANLAADRQTGNVYAHGVQGMFFCFSKDGKILWSRSLTEEFGRISGYGGRTNSPIVAGSLVIISSLTSSWGKHGRGSHRYLAMDKNTGEVVWWSQPGGKPKDTTYSVPVLTKVNGIPALVTGCADGFIYALKVSTGEKIWSFRLSKRGINSSIVVNNKHVYAMHSEENFDSTFMGRVVCIKLNSVGDITKTGEVWRIDGLPAGYTSPILHYNNLYVMDNSANVYCLDSSSGRQKWKYNYGRVAKGSGVYVDGKIYIGDVGGHYLVLKPTENECLTLHKESFFLPDGSPIEINGSPAIAYGRVYLPTNNAIYCIGLKRTKIERSFFRNAAKNVAGTGKATHLQITPGETWFSTTENKQFVAQLFNAKGKFLRKAKAKWSVKKLSGSIDQNGLYKPKNKLQEAGLVFASVGKLTASARVRVIPPLPYRENFENLPEKLPAPGWISTPLKSQVKKHEGGKVLWKMANRSAPPFARLKAYIRPPLKAGYTIQADLKGMRKKRFYPDMGLINCRYTLIMLGTTFTPKLRLVTWDPMPRLQKDIEFPWKTNKWYTAKLHVELKEGKAIVRGKVWARGEKEPQKWSIEMVDPCPNTEGSPGLYAYSVGMTPRSSGTEVFFDNLEIK